LLARGLLPNFWRYDYAPDWLKSEGGGKEDGWRRMEDGGGWRMEEGGEDRRACPPKAKQPSDAKRNTAAFTAFFITLPAPGLLETLEGVCSRPKPSAEQSRTMQTNAEESIAEQEPAPAVAARTQTSEVHTAQSTTTAGCKTKHVSCGHK
jgi:hypothetical protein